MDTVDSFKNVKPYRATKLWNELVVTFKGKVPTQNHRFRMRTYEKTFTGTGGVDWILRYLRNHDEFGPDISRQQAVQLLQKFAMCRIIEDVTNKKLSNEFQDGKKLYRIVTTPTSQSPWKIGTPLRTITQNELNSNDMSLVLKENNLLKATKEETETFQFNFDPKVYKEQPRPSSALLEGNATYHLSMPINLSAKEIMDVWKSVTWNQLEVILGIATLQDFLNPADVCGKTVRHNATRIDKNGIVSVVDKSENLPEWILCAMKCLARWPNASGSASCLPKYDGFEIDVFRVVKDHFCNSDIPLIGFNLFHLFYAAYICIAKEKPYKEINFHSKVKRNSFWEENTTNEMQFETEFSEPVPVTRLMPPFECSSLSNNSMCITTRPNSAAALARKESMLNPSENKFSQRRRCSSMECVNKASIKNTASVRNLHGGYKGSVGNLRTEGSILNLNRCLSEESLISEVVSNQATTHDNNQNNSLVRRMFVPKTLPSFYRDLNSGCQQRFVKFLQFALLLLPTGQRKRLHLLLRLLKKIVDNKQLVLFPPGCVQFMLVKTFASSIIRPKVISGQDDDAVFSCKITDFLLDHCQQVFSPPKELISEVEAILNQHATAKYGCYARCQSEPAITYCQRVSKEVYEKQKAQTSMAAISELLESIINNPKLSQKEKHKKLKMFKMQYPEIYERRFPTQPWYESEMARHERQRGEKENTQNSKWTILEKFLKLRI